MENTSTQNQYKKYISSINTSDEGLLKKIRALTRPSSKYYEDSWGYIIQSTRHNGFKWFDPVTHSLIFFGRKSKTDKTVVIPAYFASTVNLIRIIQTIQKGLGVSKVILKNVNMDDVASLKSFGFREYKKNESWSKDARFDDQTFPQQIVDIALVKEMKGKKFRHLRKELRRNSHLSIRAYRKNDEEHVLRIFALKDGTMSKTKDEKEAGMYYESHIMYPMAHVNKFVIVDRNTNEIIGFTAFSTISENHAALFCSLFIPGRKLVAIWGIYHTLCKMLDKGIKTVNFGGCEALGSYAFVHHRFQPVAEIRKTHLIYEKNGQ